MMLRLAFISLWLIVGAGAVPPEQSARDRLIFAGHGRDVLSVVWSTDTARLHSVAADNTLKTWDTSTGKELASVPILDGHPMGKQLRSVTWSPDRTRLAVGCNAGHRVVHILEAATGREALTLVISDPSARPTSGLVGGVTWSPDGKWLTVGSHHREGNVQAVLVWDAVTGEKVDSLDVSGGFSTVWWFPDSKKFLTRQVKSPLVVWDVATRKPIKAIEGVAPDLSWVAFTRDRRQLAGLNKTQIEFWEVENPKLRLTIPFEYAPFGGGSWSPDGKYFASANATDTIIVWDAGTGEERLQLRGHNGPFHGAVWSPDGRKIASAGNDWTVSLWPDLTLGSVEKRPTNR